MSSLLRLSRLPRVPRPSQLLRDPARPTPTRPTQLLSELSRTTRRPSSNYNPHYERYERHIRANMTMLYTLMGVNVGVFAYAVYVKAMASQGQQLPLIKFLQNMTLNADEFRSGRYWILLTSCFTHLDFGHVFSNMFTVYFLGRFLAQAPIVTPGRFLNIALGSGVAGSLGFLVNRWQKTQGSGQRDPVRGVGFSGAVMGISTVAACLAPTAKVHLYGIVPLPLWALVAGYAVYDGYYLNSNDTRIGHAGHLGGLVFGGVYYLLRLRGLRF